jgi:DmsE family decaheme c-type cytochrome
MRRTMLFLTLLAAFVLVGGRSAFAQAPPATWSVTDCQGCHEKALGPSFQNSNHGKLNESCANCHDKIGEHAKAQLNGEKGGPLPSVKNLSASQLNQKCLTCHEKANQANFVSSMHSRRNVACTACHGVHTYKSLKAQLKTVSDTELCFTCHKTERAKSMRTSHHPVREGKMGCASCHNPHNGATVKMIKADSINELCYTCHTEKRGPFLWEHAPVREECVTCHEPHGTNHSRLLTQKLPQLCYNCHLTGGGHFGQGDNLNTEKGVPTAPVGAVSGYPARYARFAERACRNCHSQIHGSNHPSGTYFVR